ncbi:MAG: Response regulator [Rhizorhabdus sp.]|nr:Response regulator [Rhizorhabdus sp.]
MHAAPDAQYIGTPRLSLGGRAVLVAEGDRFIGDYVASVLKKLGAGLVITARSAAEADARLASVGDVAVAAVAADLTDGSAWQFARSLGERQIPFILLFAPGDPPAPPDLSGIAAICRPFAAYQVIDTMLDALEADARKKVVGAFRRNIAAVPGVPSEDEAGGGPLEAATDIFMALYGRFPTAGEIEHLCLHSAA